MTLAVIYRSKFAVLLTLVLAFGSTLCFCRPAMAQLTASDLVLVVNKKQPVGRELAELYAKTRGVPDGRIIEIDVPDATQIDYQTMQFGIAKRIRDELAARKLTDTVRCIVLFYGVPLRMADPLPEDARNIELTQIKRLLDQANQALTQVTADMEQLAREVEPGFVPQGDGSTPSLMRRVSEAEKIARQSIGKVTDATTRQSISARFREIQARMLPAATTRPVGTTTRPVVQPPQQQEITALLQDQDRPQSRQKLRNVVTQFGSLGERVSLLTQQDRWLSMDRMTASVDSELVMLLAPNFQRIGWLPNPLNYRQQDVKLAYRPLMTSRIDAPTPAVARRIITDSFAAEEAGLVGTVVVDARGNKSNDGYGQYDQTLRNLAELVRTKTNLKLVFDDQDAVMTPDISKPDAQPKDVVLYAGWYALQSYRPFGMMKPGCVGYHIASFELTDMRKPGTSEWVPNMLNNGAAATTGSVDEPYTLAFPFPDEFFPLLLADRMTLAEAYWRTALPVSWRGVLVGDPLYRPFRVNKPLKPEDLPRPIVNVRPIVTR